MRIALHGGRPALADFQLTPPFGSSIFQDEARYSNEEREWRIVVGGGEFEFQEPRKMLVRERVAGSGNTGGGRHARRKPLADRTNEASEDAQRVVEDGDG
jgi:hypothetical protein